MEVGMRRVLFSTISLLALSAASALAADIPRAAPAYRAPVAVPVFNWTGGYIGINAGYGWGRSDWSGFGADADPSGGLAGLTLGYNWQAAGPWVFGIEGDINWSDIKGDFVNAACRFGCEIKNQWFGTARGRVGYAMDRVMPYLTGGLAFGDVRTTINGVAGARDTNVGWTLGGGIEGAITPNWTAKLEYLYVDLGDVSCGVLACAAATPDFQSHIVRAGLNYKF
jgi:outer membrane immunogenic protein